MTMKKARKEDGAKVNVEVKAPRICSASGPALLSSSLAFFLLELLSSLTLESKRLQPNSN